MDLEKAAYVVGVITIALGIALALLALVVLA